MANSHYTVTTLKDFSDENTSFRIYNGAITAVSLPGFLTDYGNLKTALAAITIGTVYKDLWVGDSTILDETIPTDPFAQREIGLRFYYRGVNTGESHFFTVGTVDLDAVGASPGLDIIPSPYNATLQAFVDAVETIGRAPEDDTDLIQVYQVKVVGRNS